MKDKIKQTILSILAEKRRNGDVLPFATQLYKLAGNSIVVQCMAGIFRNAFSTDEVESMTLF